jgi:PAS domain S-box-containing protein
VPCLAAFAACLLLCAASLAAADAPALEELHTAERVRRLTPEQAALHYPVRLRGTITFFDQPQFFRFVQDETAGVYFFLDDSTNNPRLAAGQLVEIEGEANPGEYAPIIVPRHITILGQGTYPPAIPASFEQVASGQNDSQFVEVRGIVRSAHPDEQTKYFFIEIATGGGRLTALARELPVARSEDLADSIVRARGVCITRFNRQRQLFDTRLLVPRPEDLVVELPARSDPFSVPTQPIGSLLKFAPEGSYGHRVKVSGIVISPTRDSAMYIQDETEGLCVKTAQSGSLHVGDRVEVVGFPAKGEYTPLMQDAVFRTVETGQPPKPDPVTADEALIGTHDCRLVRIEATVLDRARRSREQFLVLDADRFIFDAYLERPPGGAEFASLRNGSKVAVTGVCLIETGNEWRAGPEWRAKSFRILMRSPEDVVVLKRPPWWTLEKLLWAVALLGVVVLGALTWVAVLRRRVRQQTGIISQKLQQEAALKERYVELFENANDMVFTHDLTGRITSMNRAGERLLQRDREQIVSRNLVELVAEEQRAEAAQWLDQVVKGAESPPAEWDFLNAAGQRLKLEISTRMVEQGGKYVEVEGIGRDITERKHLERELLEVSNREQRRIGHDLHDGVCQQLAAIAYLTDILADQLQAQGHAASSEAEKIGRLINETISQTRSVARGLFPVRLEENGITSALEELAANTSSLFKINCRFSCEHPLPPLENGAALHLYYIVQEAVLNAAKHGKAANIEISLANSNERLALTVKDDGAGFQVSGVTGAGMGIRIMRYRARVIGAILDLKSQPGHGTQVTCGFHSLHENSTTNGRRN